MTHSLLPLPATTDAADALHEITIAVYAFTETADLANALDAEVDLLDRNLWQVKVPEMREPVWLKAKEMRPWLQRYAINLAFSRWEEEHPVAADELWLVDDAVEAACAAWADEARQLDLFA